MDLGNVAEAIFAKFIANSVALSLKIPTCKNSGVIEVRSLCAITLVICAVQCRPY